MAAGKSAEACSAAIRAIKYDQLLYPPQAIHRSHVLYAASYAQSPCPPQATRCSYTQRADIITLVGCGGATRPSFMSEQQVSEDHLTRIYSNSMYAPLHLVPIKGEQGAR